jgi:hypothetical protein
LLNIVYPQAQDHDSIVTIIVGTIYSEKPINEDSLVTDYLIYNIQCFEVYDKNLNIFTFYNIDGDAIKSDEGISNNKLIDNLEKKCTLNDRKMERFLF